jgi:hypothetical protein
MPTHRSHLNAIDSLKADHRRVEGLFDRFETASDARDKKRIVQEAINELKVHSAIEEEIFYPAIREEVDSPDLMNEADEEHHAAKVLIAELESMEGDESHFEAKFTVLGENIRHHIKEEEEDMFTKAEGTDIDFERLGARMEARRAELNQKGVPFTGEDWMVAASAGEGDSSAKNAHRHIKTPKRRRP